MALNKPSKLYVTWSSKSPIQEVDKLKLALQKVFTNVTSIEADKNKVIIELTYTSSTKTIEKKLQPFNGYVNWSRGGPLTAAQEDTVSDIFDCLGALTKPTTSKRRREVTSDSDSDEGESESKTLKKSRAFKKRSSTYDEASNCE